MLDRLRDKSGGLRGEQDWLIVCPHDNFYPALIRDYTGFERPQRWASNPGRNFGKVLPSCHANLFTFPVIFLYEFSLTDHQNGQMESGKPLSKRYLQAMEIRARFRISVEKLADVQNSDRLGKCSVFVSACREMSQVFDV